MKLSTIMIAGAALMGAAAVVSSASATTVTVYEGYNYTSADSAYLYATTDGALTDLNIGGVDLGALGSGGTSTTVDIGDPWEGGWTNFTVTAAGAGVSGSSGFTALDYDYQTAGEVLGSFNLSAGGVPEPANWALMLLGVGGVGAVLRTKRRAVKFA